LLCKSDLRTKNSVLLFGQNFQWRVVDLWRNHAKIDRIAGL
jgi:hypothetical protein